MSDAGFQAKAAPRRIRSGGVQRAYHSMINRRFEVLPPTLPNYRPDLPISVKLGQETILHAQVLNWRT